MMVPRGERATTTLSVVPALKRTRVLICCAGGQTNYERNTSGNGRLMRATRGGNHRNEDQHAFTTDQSVSLQVPLTTVNSGTISIPEHVPNISEGLINHDTDTAHY